MVLKAPKCPENLSKRQNMFKLTKNQNHMQIKAFYVDIWRFLAKSNFHQFWLLFSCRKSANFRAWLKAKRIRFTGKKIASKYFSISRLLILRKNMAIQKNILKNPKISGSRRGFAALPGGPQGSFSDSCSHRHKSIIKLAMDLASSVK